MNRPPKNNRMIVAVLGMHRGGTSAVTRGLTALGVELGLNLVEPGFDNPTGFWEDREIVDLNDRLLHQIGISYESVALVPRNLHTDPDFEALRSDATKLVQSRLDINPLWGLKDPRLCRLLPFWKPIFNQCAATVCYVISVRDPLSVAHSLQARNQFPVPKSFLLWLQHYAGAVCATHGTTREFVEFDALIDHPSAMLERVATTLGLPLTAERTAAIGQFAESFVSTELRHHQFSREDLAHSPFVFDAMFQAYDLLLAAARQPELGSDRQFIASWDALETELRRISSVLAFLSERDYAALVRDIEVGGLQTALASRNAELANLKRAMSAPDKRFTRAERVRRAELAMGEQADEVARMTGELNSTKRRVSELEARLADREKQIAVLAGQVTDRDAQITQLADEVSKREVLISQLQSGLTVREQQYGELEQTLVDRDSHIDELNQTVAVHAQQSVNLGQQLAEREHRVSELSERLNRTNAELDTMINSHSWLLTSPLRSVRRTLMTNPYSYWQGRRTMSEHARRTWHSLPISIHSKQQIKNALFRRFPRVFGWSQAYHDWQSLSAPTSSATGITATIRSDANASGDRDAVCVPLFHGKPLENTPARVICFYLPQFHPIPENDAWWGDGFTEWTNVRPAQAQFSGHYQPHVPNGLGYYSLLDTAVQRRQIELAKLYGIEGFCFYFYWFSGKRLLEAPVENFLKQPDLDLPFCLCWANENWSRRWDGLDSEILIGQQHSPEDDLAFIEHVAQYMRDPRYIRVQGKPLLLVYRPSLLPSAKATARRWRKWCQDNGIGPIFLAYTQSFEMVHPAKYGFDAAIEFPPNNSAAPIITDSVDPLRDDFKCTVYDWRVFTERSRHYKQAAYTLFRGVCPSWDNTPRRKNAATVFLNSAPALYQEWLDNAIRDTEKHQPNSDQRLIFVNAWNEWAEGAYLEPDERYGYAYLQATRNALQRSADPAISSLLLVTHDCHPHGAQFLLLELARQLSKCRVQISILALAGGKLLNNFSRVAPTLNAEDADTERVHEFLAAQREKGTVSAITSTVVSGAIVPTLKQHGYRVLGLIHELPGIIHAMGQEDNARSMAQLADSLVFPAEMVFEQFCTIAPVDRKKVLIRPQGLLRKNPYKSRAPEAHSVVCQRHGLPADTRIVLNIAFVDARKGADLFVEIAHRVLTHRNDTVFIWVGHADPEMMHTVESRIYELGLVDRVLFIGFDAAPFEYYAASAVYALTSREDPFPNVVLESCEVGVPVVAFGDTTGAAKFIEDHGGRIADHLDVEDFAVQVSDLLDRAAPSATPPVPSIHQYALDLLHCLDALPRISVVVPSYNYQKYIVERLESIRRQTFPIYELIILDDASSDGSVSTIQSYLERTGLDARLIINESRSGSVFRQWQKGIDLCNGDLVWIAEADDSAEDSFLRELATGFRDPDVVLAYSQSKQINSDGALLADNYLAYTKEISDRWRYDYCVDGREEIGNALSIKNTIPNVSAVLFQRAALESALKAIGDELYDYRVAGDWLIYLHILTQGNVYYRNDALNLHRRHTRSVTRSTQTQRHLEEVRQMQLVARSLSAPSQDSLAKADAYIAYLEKYFKNSKKKVKRLKRQSDVSTTHK